MNSRHPRTRTLIASLAVTLLVAVASASAATAIHFTHESFQDFQRQLNSRQIKAVTFNKKAHTVHVTLSDGRHVLASYPPKQEPAIAAQIQAKGATVKVEKKKVKPVHHKLRYIAAGVLVVLIVIVAVVLALNRRRPPAAPDAGPAAAGAGAGPPTGEADAHSPATRATPPAAEPPAG